MIKKLFVMLLFTLIYLFSLSQVRISVRDLSTSDIAPGIRLFNGIPFNGIAFDDYYEFTYVKGVINGPYKRFENNYHYGKKPIEKVLIDSGIYVSVKINDREFIQLYEGDRFTFFFPSGNLKSKSLYKSNKIVRQEEFYENGQLSKIMSFKDGYMFHGSYIEFHKNGKTKITCNYINNQLDGEYREYSPDSILLVKAYISSDTIFGPIETYFSDGSPEYKLNSLSEFNFRKLKNETSSMLQNSLFNRFIKPVIGHTFFNTAVAQAKPNTAVPQTIPLFSCDSSEINNTVIYTPVLLLNNMECTRIPHGVQEMYNYKGLLQKRSNFQFGLLDGVYEEFNDCGKLIMKCHFRDNLLDGEYIQNYYDRNGNCLILKKCFYKKGILNGSYFENNIDGSIKIQGFYSNGKFVF